MVSMERKHELCSPFIRQRDSLRKTSAEIVHEARQSLRVQSTLRPFTPRDGHRQLFGNGSVRAGRDSRPPSAFRLVISSTGSDSEIHHESHITRRGNDPFSHFTVFMHKILMLLTLGRVRGLVLLLWTM